ncbi:MAG: protein kinase domain-containing protein, partial [Gemmatimonadales bacterium]
QVSTAGVVLGHPAYMSPEQARGTPELDGRSDVYSLGCVLYEMLAGSPPFSGATRAALLARQISETPPPIRTVRPGMPPELEQVVVRALAKRPGDRFATGKDLAAALQAVSGV